MLKSTGAFMMVKCGRSLETGVVKSLFLIYIPRFYDLMLNVDWFQPFSRRNDGSVVVLYQVLMNLPRSVRFHRENVILVGLIPALNY